MPSYPLPCCFLSCFRHLFARKRRTDFSCFASVVFSEAVYPDLEMMQYLLLPGYELSIDGWLGVLWNTEYLSKEIKWIRLKHTGSQERVVKYLQEDCKLRHRDRVGSRTCERFAWLFPREWDGKEQKLSKGQRDVTVFKLFNQMRYGRSRKKVRFNEIKRAGTWALSLGESAEEAENWVVY